MLSKLIKSIKEMFNETEHQKIYFKHLLDLLETKNIETQEKQEEKIKLELKNTKNKLRAFNKDLMTLSQKKPSDNLPESTKDKITDSIVDFISESKKLIKNLNCDEEQINAFLNIIKDSEINIKEYENQIKEQRDFLEDFFKEEITDIDESLQEVKVNFELLDKKFSTINTNNVNELKLKIKEFLENYKQQEELLEKQNKIKQNLAKIEELKESFLDKIENLKSSPDYGKFHETINKRRIILDKISETKEIFEHDFSKIKSAIKLYNIKNYRNILKKYLQEPFSALLEDEGEKLAPILTDVKRYVETGEIRLATDNKRKTIETIQKLNHTYLFEITNDYNQARNEKVQYDKILSTNKVMSDYSELEYKIDHINKKVKAQKEVLKEVITQIKSNDYKILISDIENHFEEIFGLSIEVIFTKEDEFKEDTE